MPRSRRRRSRGGGCARRSSCRSAAGRRRSPRSTPPPGTAPVSTRSAHRPAPSARGCGGSSSAACASPIRTRTGPVGKQRQPFADQRRRASPRSPATARSRPAAPRARASASSMSASRTRSSCIGRCASRHGQRARRPGAGRARLALALGSAADRLAPRPAPAPGCAPPARAPSAMRLRRLVGRLLADQRRQAARVFARRSCGRRGFTDAPPTRARRSARRDCSPAGSPKPGISSISGPVGSSITRVEVLADALRGAAW